MTVRGPAVTEGPSLLGLWAFVVVIVLTDVGLVCAAGFGGLLIALLVVVLLCCFCT